MSTDNTERLQEALANCAHFAQEAETKAHNAGDAEQRALASAILAIAMNALHESGVTA